MDDGVVGGVGGIGNNNNNINNNPPNNNNNPHFPNHVIREITFRELAEVFGNRGEAQRREAQRLLERLAGMFIHYFQDPPIFPILDPNLKNVIYLGDLNPLSPRPDVRV